MTFPTAPGDLGHEGWGVVDRVGENVADIAEGDRVAALSYRAYAQYDIAEAGNVVALPRSLADTPFPGEPFGCAMNIFARSGIRSGDTVAIIGIGFLGSILTRLAASAGARVIAVSRRAFARDMAKRMGAAEALDAGDPQSVVAHVGELTDGRLCERVIEATGKQGPLTLAGELTAERGRLIIAGYHQDGPREVNMQLWNWRGIDVINAHERDPAAYIQGIRDAVAAVLDGRIDPGALITHRYDLKDLGKALDATRDRPDGFLKAWVSTR
jgi:threonine dehydrogenase-like Zn-dependent dehydrogenase